MERKKLLAILSRYLWPVDGGRKESLNHYFKELYDNYGYDIHIMCFLEYGQTIKKDDFPYYISEVIQLKDVSTGEKIKNAITKSLGTDKWPFQCSLYYSQDNFEKIALKVGELHPDVIFTEMIRTCTYYDAFSDSGALLLANLDDLLSNRYERQSKSGKSMASFAGSYTDKLPKLLATILNEGSVKNTVLKMESKRCAIWEDKFYKLYDFSLMTSDVERDLLNERMEDNKAKTLSVGIDYEYYSEKMAFEKDPIGLSYLGNFNVAANADTLEMIINDVLPYIKSDYHFYIIGKCPDYILERHKNNDNLIFCGRVDDLREYVKKATVFLAPIAYGTGVKTKIVEAMAMEMPVVTNSVGAEGIYAVNGKHFFVYDDPKKIAEVVDKLLSDRKFSEEIGKNAGHFAYTHFRWEKVLSVYKELGV